MLKNKQTLQYLSELPSLKLVMKALQEYYVNILNFLEMNSKEYKVSFNLVTTK